MKYFSRQCGDSYPKFTIAVILGIGLSLAPGARAQMGDLVQLMDGSSPLLHAGSQGYLGVDLADVDAQKAQELKLAEARGALITLIDHDAPAGQIGLRVNDVILQMNGQNVQNAEQLRQILKEIPPGRKVSIEISRDGNIQTLAVQLADRKAVEHEVWNSIGDGGDVFPPAPAMGMLSGSSDSPMPGGFHLPFFGSTLNVGALVEPLTSQMAAYLGVASGLMVRQVARKSEAALAGLKAFDVILKIGPETVTNVAGWDRALRANRGKPVQVTILRDRKQQILTLQVDSKHQKGELNFEEPGPVGACELMAEADPGMAWQFDAQTQAAAEAMRQQAEALRNEMQGMRLGLSPQQAEALREQVEKLRGTMKSEDFSLGPQQMGQLRQQMDEWRKSFNPENFKLDQKQMENLRRQMEQFRQQMEEMKNLESGNPV